MSEKKQYLYTSKPTGKSYKSCFWYVCFACPKTRKMEIKAYLSQEEYSNIKERYKLNIILILPYFGPETAVYKTTNLLLLTTFSKSFLLTGTLFIIKNYMTEKRTELHIL